MCVAEDAFVHVFVFGHSYCGQLGVVDDKGNMLVPRLLHEELENKMVLQVAAGE